VTEIGDKTFFIAAVLAMRNGRMIVYLGCMGEKTSLDDNQLLIIIISQVLWL
jgi:putative Ca2+/H+ antiporter (TMEM165/GDT1 family)